MLNMPFPYSLYVAIITLAIILLSLSIHEAAHGWIAHKLGDDTAKLMGRLSLNPAAHWDPIGTTLLAGLILLQGFGIPIMAFGWGKPVPVNEGHFKNPRRDMLFTALAGPLSNFLTAILLAGLLHLIGAHSEPVLYIFIASISLNLFLGLFNLIPVPPLDGSNILRAILPDRIFDQIAQYSNLFMGAIFIFVFLFSSVLDNIVNILLKLLLF